MSDSPAVLTKEYITPMNTITTYLLWWYIINFSKSHFKVYNAIVMHISVYPHVIAPKAK